MKNRVVVVAYSSAGKMGGLVGMVEVEIAGDSAGPTVGFGACGIPDCKNWAWKNLCAELRVAPIQIVLGAGILRVSNNPGLPCTSIRSFQPVQHACEDSYVDNVVQLLCVFDDYVHEASFGLC